MAVSVPWLLGLALHGAVFLCGIVCASALTVAQGEFGGQCLLYGAVSWNGTALVPRSFSRVSLCYFVSAVSVVVALCCFAVLLYSCCADEPHRSRACRTFTLVVATVILLFLLVSACILRAGMDVLCASIVHTKQLASCQEAEHKPWVSYSPSRFYSNLYSAQVSRFSRPYGFAERGVEFISHVRTWSRFSSTSRASRSGISSCRLSSRERGRPGPAAWPGLRANGLELSWTCPGAAVQGDSRGLRSPQMRCGGSSGVEAPHPRISKAVSCSRTWPPLSL
ncbi:transmembrane protein 179B-like isoform X1 [Anser cygnoides]|uniref:transmembrane protein 179B-like isoform X1 n=1 Tax=Anser cygnoides TaxID=8845 RepID=UPI0034D15602